ncbi:MAG: hypothetical protein FHOMOCKG_00053 [Methanophagales virus GBV302]|uniref:Uncharacterized protein n=1 Tax=Methanophagales virus GBV302 TaxID=2999281 RepID=A0A9E9A668_9CAUD|nr:MAG: hypothetical protein QIT37_gp053 [Methanophagales virus GBV302]WAE39581.1 MAG: hypothetical protein FHOMOCKG_00053 [Methanophagales virus GBV302]
MGDWEDAWAKEMEISEAQEALDKLRDAIKKMRETEEKVNKLLVMLNANH